MDGDTQPGSDEKKKPTKARAAKIAGLAATILWVAGFAILFIIPAKSPFIWLSDFLLLLGFWPLLWIWRPGWPWIIFGVLNMAIGFFLEIAYALPDTNFTPEMKIVRNHLHDMHSSLTWILVGFVSALFGVFRTNKQIWQWITARSKQK
jgi:uncharacterized membrane protein YfcA